jgi:para-nitrobenzyl esterase
VFIYGGGGTIGSSGMANYDGEQVARRGAVFVNFNYRVGILGFMAHPELTKEQGGHSGNYGYLDQTAALKWIQRNIAAFGGDPAKVIISGQSAGAGSVVQQIFSPLAKGLFRGAVMLSGCNYVSSNTPLADAEATGLEVQKRLEAASLDEMRQIPADRILAVQSEQQVGRSVQGIRTGGVIDGYFMPATKAAILEARGAADIPIIASYTHDEANIALKAARTVAEYNAGAKQVFGKAADEFLSLYPVASDADVRAVAQEAANDAAGLFNSCACAELQAKYNKSPTFITVFSRRHPYVPGVQIADQNTATVGAYHTSEVPYYFGTQDAYNMFRPTRDWTAWDRELSQKMTAVLVAFANTGNPTTPDVQWPAWSAQAERYVDFGDRIAIGTVNRVRIDFMAKNRPSPAPPGAGPRRPRD